MVTTTRGLARFEPAAKRQTPCGGVGGGIDDERNRSARDSFSHNRIRDYVVGSRALREAREHAPARTVGRALFQGGLHVEGGVGDISAGILELLPVPERALHPLHPPEHSPLSLR